MWERTFVGEEEGIKMNAELAARRDFTVEDIENLPDGVRAELIDGQIFYFASPRTIHQRLQAELGFGLYNYIKNRNMIGEVLFFSMPIMFGDKNNNYLLPDILFVDSDEKLMDDGCHGAPDLVIEIVSKSTSKRDYGIKMLKYRTAGVKEYWIVDPIKETVMVFWFEDETQNELYSLYDEIEFHLFPGLKVKLG